CDVFPLGLLDYQKAWDLQRELVGKRLRKEINDTLLLVEHPPLFTIGRGGNRRNILISDKHLEEKGVSVYEVDRGGDITYHGPGQIIGYPILALNEHGRDVHLMLRNLEEVIIGLLSGYGVEALRIPGYTGVWVGKEKIAAIGIGVRRWITFHGFCLNVNPDLDYFSLINPCGLRGKKVTSLEKLQVDITPTLSLPPVCVQRTGRHQGGGDAEGGAKRKFLYKGNIDKERLERRLVEHFGEVFNLKMRYVEGAVPDERSVSS
ncbi:lipoyl(octanoyl) transferase LipB, partial [candidate division NPL-UPA2 bacterium]|nr:lipoyl(octanoyl) transferase LipB [candidate division NPL-UPA2 bacterium]